MRILILAPHCDDEIIGLYKFIRSDDIKKNILFIFEDYNVKRSMYYNRVFTNHKFLLLNETKYNFSNVFDLAKEIKESIPSSILIYDRIYVPNIRDNHISHKLVNIAAKMIFPLDKLFYYDVEMNLAKPVDSETRIEKEKYLNFVYPDKMKDLMDKKYFLFENTQKADFGYYVIITYNILGSHRYPNAKGKYGKSLSYNHQHNFKFWIKLQVLHDNREIEFMELRDELYEYTYNLLNKDESNGMSCETMAYKLAEYLFVNYPSRNFEVRVYEDDGVAGVFEWKI